VRKVSSQSQAVKSCSAEPEGHRPPMGYQRSLCHIPVTPFLRTWCARNKSNRSGVSRYSRNVTIYESRLLMTVTFPSANTQPFPTEISSEFKALSTGIYVGAAVTLGCYLSYRRLIRFWFDPHIGAAILASILLIVAPVFILIGRKYAFAVGLVGTFLAWPLIIQSEFSKYSLYSSWDVFDIPGANGSYQETRLLIAKLSIFVTALLFLATSYSLLRLCPVSWRIGKHAMRDQTWLVCLATLFVVATWYVESASPWRIPIYDAHGWNWNARLCVLHVEKRGLQIRETSVAIRSGRNFHITRDERRLFHYSFQEVHTDGAMSEEDLLRLQPVIYSPPPYRKQIPHYTPPRGWNADRWFVYSQGRPIPSLFNVDKSSVPADIITWFYKAQGLDEIENMQVTERDV